MSTSSLNLLNNNYLQSILDGALQNNGVQANTSASGVSTASTQQADSSQFSSPLVQVLSTLQQLQQSNPTEYQQVTQQIATNLQNAAQSASTDGNSTAANQLNQLATDFNNASQSGQLPNIGDLAQAMGGAEGHHHHHHGHHASLDESSSDSTSNTSSTPGTSSSTSSSSTNSSSSSSGSTTASNFTNPFAQFIEAYQANAQQNEALNPMSIIMNTLNSAGITSSNS